MIGDKDRWSLVLRRWSPVGVATLSLATLGLILWAGAAVWQRPCRGTGIVPGGPPGCPSLLKDLTPLIIALGFWAIGLVVWCANRRSPMIEPFLPAAAALAAGKLGGMGSDGGGRLFYLLLAWLAPLTFHFHFTLLERSLGRVERIVLCVFYSLAVIWSLPFLFWTRSALEQRGWFTTLRPGVRLTFALSILWSILLLFLDYRRRASPEARRRIRLITFGTLLAFAPLLLLSLLPETLGAPLYVPYEWTFPGLLLSPLSYVYALFRRRLMRAEVALNRAAVYYLLITLLLSAYLVIAAALNRWTATSMERWPLAGVLVNVGLLLLFVPLRQALQRLLHWVLYGGEIRYEEVVGRVAQALSHALDREGLQRLLIEELAAAMRLTKSALLLKGADGALTLLGATGFAGEELAGCRIPGEGRLAGYLAAVAAPVPHHRVRGALAGASLEAQEQALLSRTDIALWVPLVSGGGLQGLLLLGPRPEDEFFTPEDERILATLVGQGGVAAQNVRLLEELRAERAELARAHRQLQVGREREQRRLAHELHDTAVQQLLGISYLVARSRRRLGDGHASGAEMRAELAAALEAIQREVLGVVRELRGLIGEMQPGGLEELGLSTALESYVARLIREGGPAMPQIELDLDPSGTALPESVALCLFRAAQEGLRNALKHAKAQHIRITLRLRADEVVLRVWDDGCGFKVPARLSELVQSDHFGLVSMAERVAWAGGRLTVRSQPGVGTEVTVRMPMGSRAPGADGG